MMRFGDVWIKGGFLSSLGVRRQKVVQILKPLLWNRFYWEEDQRNKSFLIRDENIIANSVNRIQTLSSHFRPQALSSSVTSYIFSNISSIQTKYFLKAFDTTDLLTTHPSPFLTFQTVFLGYYPILSNPIHL